MSGSDVALNRDQNRPYIWINTPIHPLSLAAISKELSFQPAGFEKTTKYMTGEWNGWVHLLYETKNKKSHFFPQGLLEPVQRVLESLGYNVSYHGQKVPPPAAHTIQWLGPELRPYQLEVIAEIHKHFRAGRGVIVALPTGAGKTMTALRVIQSLGLSTIITVHTKELIKQWQEAIQQNLGIKCAVYGSGKKESGDITVATVQTLEKIKGLNLPQDMIIFDECHHYSSKTFYNVAMHSNAYYRLGLSATPKREDGTEMKFIGGIGEIIAPVTVQDLIQQGYLAQPRLEILTSPAPERLGYNYQDAYKNGIVLNPGRNKLIIDKAIELSNEGLQVYIHVTRIDQGKKLTAMLPGSEFVSGQDKKETRERVLDAFKTRQLSIMISTLMGEGIDIPAMDAIIIACGGKSETALIQRVGRALRQSPGKEGALIIDFADSGKWLRDHYQQRRMTYANVFGI